jgi:hypothetical protein
MLAPETLNELVRRDSGLTTSLTTAAWPGLSVESKLQLVQRVSEMSPGGETPLWLVALALGDPNEVVRVWGLRWTTLRPSGEAVPAAGVDVEAPTPPPMANTEPSELAARLHAEALADRSALVKANVREDRIVGFDTLSAMPQFERLVFLRRLRTADIGSFFGWLHAAAGAGLPDGELAQCVAEFVAHDHVRHELARGDDHDDGTEAVSSGQTLKLAWDLFRQPLPATQRILAPVLPTRLGRHHVAVDELAALPEAALVLLMGVDTADKGTVELQSRVRQHPNDFPRTVVQALAAMERQRKDHSTQQEFIRLASDLQRQLLEGMQRQAANVRPFVDRVRDRARDLFR